MRLIAFSALMLLSIPLVAQETPKVPDIAHKEFLLPNGWKLTPVGKHLVTTDLPLNIIPLNDNRYVLVASSGFNTHELLLVDLNEQPKVVSKMTQRQSWFGLATNAEQSKLWWSNGGQGSWSERRANVLKNRRSSEI